MVTTCGSAEEAGKLAGGDPDRHEGDDFVTVDLRIRGRTENPSEDRILDATLCLPLGLDLRSRKGALCPRGETQANYHTRLRLLPYVLQQPARRAASRARVGIIRIDRDRSFIWGSLHAAFHGDGDVRGKQTHCADRAENCAGDVPEVDGCHGFPPKKPATKWLGAGLRSS